MRSGKPQQQSLEINLNLIIQGLPPSLFFAKDTAQKDLLSVRINPIRQFFTGHAPAKAKKGFATKC